MDHTTKKQRGGGWLAIALLFGMLIWVRLRLVTDIPRSAYADPGAEHPRHIEPAQRHAPPPAQAVAHTPHDDPQ